MIDHPLENRADFTTAWIQTRPKITQTFGGDFKLNGKWVYKGLGLKGHNGIDFRGKDKLTGEYYAIFAPMDGYVKIKQSKGGYGLHIKMRSEYGREVVIGHLSEVNEAKDGSFVYAGEYLGRCGNTGLSTAPHLHFGFRRLQINKKQNIWKWSVDNYDNGYLGYVDILPHMRTWKGTHTDSTLSDNYN